jgi:hypothetical protein
MHRQVALAVLSLVRPLIGPISAVNSAAAAADDIWTAGMPGGPADREAAALHAPLTRLAARAEIGGANDYCDGR